MHGFITYLCTHCVISTLHRDTNAVHWNEPDEILVPLQGGSRNWVWWGHWAGETCEDSGDDPRIVLIPLTFTHAQPEHATHTMRQ